MTGSYPCHNIHQQGVMIHGQVHFFKYRGTLKLAGCYFIVTRTKRNTQLITLIFKVAHKGIYPFRNGTKIMVLQLLAFSGAMAKYSTTTHDQVRAGIEKSFVHYEVLLFPSQGWCYSLYIPVEIVAYINSSLVKGFKSF